MPQTKLKSTDGFKLGAYKALPAGTPKGGVVVIQEIFGVNAHIRDVVDGYAEAGYAAIAPQLFDRVERDVELGYSEQAEFDKGLKLAFQDLPIVDALKDVQATVNAIAEYGKVGVVGYCYGGLLTWLSACEVEGVAAASAYYGGGTAAEAGRTPKCPIILHFGENDTHIPMSEVDKIRALHPNLPVFLYDAGHGFNCDQRGSFDADSAQSARARTLAFFGEHLAGEGPAEL